jgi:HEAT repeat protein
MKTSKGRRTALAAILLAAAAIAGVGAASHPLVLERWWIWKLDSKDFPARLAAAEKLGRMGSLRSIPKLVDLLEDTDRQVEKFRYFTAADRVGEILEGLGTPAVPALSRALRETAGEKEYWRRIACRALGRIGGPEAVAALAERLTDGWVCVQMQAFHALGEQGPRAEAAVPAISARIQDPQRDVRAWAQAALKKIRPASTR